MSDERNYKEVRFDEYCFKCIFKDNTEDVEPCDECLAEPAVPYSHKPVKFKEDTRKNRQNQ